MKNRDHSTNIKICGPTRNFSSFESASVKEILDYFSDKEEVEVDTETTGFDPLQDKIVALQLGDKNRQYVIDVRSVDIQHFKDLIESKLCLLQNAKFDYKMLYQEGIILNDIYDTMLGELIIFNGFDSRKSSLEAIAKNYLSIELEKETRNTFGSLNGEPFTDRQIKYAGSDVAHLGKIKRLQLRYIKKYDLHNAIDLAMKVLKPLGDMELNGMYLDKEAWMKLAQEKRSALIKLEYKMDRYLVDEGIRQPVQLGKDLFGKETRVLDTNYGSPQQVKSILHELGMKVEGTGEPILKKLKDDDFVSMLLDHRGLSKKVSTYGKAFLKYINDATGRVHTDFWQIKSTYRLGSGNKKRNAPNVQNIPSSNEYRNCFKPREGYSWVSIDYSSQELRVMADKSNEQEFIKALDAGKDLHCFAYNKMTGEGITKEDTEKRKKSKAINFGKPYGMSPYKLADRLGISIEEAEKYFELYAKAFPSLETWLEAQGRFGNKHGYILIDKRHKGRRWFPEFKEIQNNPRMGWKRRNKLKGIIKRASMNTPIQGTSAIMTKEAMVNVRQWLIDQGYWQDEVFMICQVHDELNFEIKDELLDEIVPEINTIMIETANKYLDNLKMDADPLITKQWEKD